MAVLVGMLASGCSLMIDVDQLQCERAIDCGDFRGKPTFDCVQNVCTPVRCAGDLECSKRGDFVCESDLCAPALCTSDAECGDAAQVCRHGRCVASSLACFYDAQPRNSKEPAVMQFQTWSYAEQRPVKDLKVEVCPILDADCATPVPAEVDLSNYPKDGTIRIGGLQSGERYVVRLTGTMSNGAPLVPVDIYPMRPVVGTQIEPTRYDLFPEVTLQLLSNSLGFTWNQQLGQVTTTTFDCTSEALAGVTLTNSKSGVNVYLTSGGTAGGAETDVSGIAGFSNMELGPNGIPVGHELTWHLHGRPLFTFLVVPRAGVLTYVHMYIADHGTTANRAPSLAGL